MWNKKLFPLSESKLNLTQSKTNKQIDRINNSNLIVFNLRGWASYFYFIFTALKKMKVLLWRPWRNHWSCAVIKQKLKYTCGVNESLYSHKHIICTYIKYLFCVSLRYWIYCIHTCTWLHLHILELFFISSWYFFW